MEELVTLLQTSVSARLVTLELCVLYQLRTLNMTATFIMMATIMTLTGMNWMSPAAATPSI